MPAPTPSPLEQKAEALWKWALRGAGLLAFSYVLIVMHGDIALGAYVIIGGLIGLPNVVSPAALIAAWKESGEE